MIPRLPSNVPHSESSVGKQVVIKLPRWIVAASEIFVWGLYSPWVLGDGSPSPTGSRGEAPVRGLKIDEVLQKLKQFADIVYGF